jgi:anti-anti-sigma factor
MRAMDDRGLQVMGRAGSRKGLHILALQGSLTAGSVQSLHEAVAKAECRGLVIDMTGVTHVDSTAIGGLVRTYVSCQKNGRKLALAGTNRRVLNVLAITGVEPLFDTYPTVDEAEKSLEPAS